MSENLKSLSLILQKINKKVCLISAPSLKWVESKNKCIKKCLYLFDLTLFRPLGQKSGKLSIEDSRMCFWDFLTFSLRPNLVRSIDHAIAKAKSQQPRTSMWWTVSSGCGSHFLITVTRPNKSQRVEAKPPFAVSVVEPGNLQSHYTSNANCNTFSREKNLILATRATCTD